MGSSQGSEVEDTAQTLDEEATLLEEEEEGRGPQVARLASNASSGQSTASGISILQAVREGSVAVMDPVFDEDGVDFEEKDDKGRTPLILAASMDKTEVMNKLLINPSLEIDTTDNCQRTALHYCSRNKMNKAAKMLLDRGANANIQDGLQCPPIYYAVQNNDYDLVKLLLDHDATADVKLPSLRVSPTIQELLNGSGSNTRRRYGG